MTMSTCTISFFKNDLQRTRLHEGKCPVRDCRCELHEVPFHRYKGEMRYLPFCPEHGIRIHSDTFVYYNGPSKQDQVTAIRRNLPFHGNYYVQNVLGKPGKLESHRLCYESSEDAVTFSVFTLLLSNRHAIRELAGRITGTEVKRDVELYLWGGRIDLENGKFAHPYLPLQEVRGCL